MMNCYIIYLKLFAFGILFLANILKAAFTAVLLCACYIIIPTKWKYAVILPCLNANEQS